MVSAVDLISLTYLGGIECSLFQIDPVLDRAFAISQPLATAIDRALIDNPDTFYKSAVEFKQTVLTSIS
jgi:hypothetical protein